MADGEAERRAALLRQISCMEDASDEAESSEGEEGEEGEEADDDDDDDDDSADSDEPVAELGELLPPRDAEGCVVAPPLNRQLRAYRDALRLDETTLASLRRDCAIAFALDGSNWLPADQSPRCLMESLASAIFERHTRGVEMDRSKSGAEWWAQVRTPGDENESITFHWDVDEYCQDALGVAISPALSTVTYLSDLGAPTLVLDVPTPKRYAVRKAYGPVHSATLCYPRCGKHLVFDGRLLHGAVPIGPTSFTQAKASQPLGTPITAVEQGATGGADPQDPAIASALGALRASSKVAAGGEVRVTFLVNIWLHHQPANIEELPANLVPTFTKVPVADSAAAAAVKRLSEPAAQTVAKGALHTSSEDSTGISQPLVMSRQPPSTCKVLETDFGRGRAKHRLRVTLPTRSAEAADTAPMESGQGKKDEEADTIALDYSGCEGVDALVVANICATAQATKKSHAQDATLDEAAEAAPPPANKVVDANENGRTTTESISSGQHSKRHKR